jgi:hypothetical protein
MQSPCGFNGTGELSGIKRVITFTVIAACQVADERGAYIARQRKNAIVAWSQDVAVFLCFYCGFSTQR